MIKSMTGFASLTHEDGRASITVTVRAVNHRFLDMQLRLPQSLGDLEPKVRSILQKRLAGGHPITRIHELLPWNFKAERQPAATG